MYDMCVYIYLYIYIYIYIYIYTHTHTHTHTYTIEYHSALKEGNPAICEAMGKSRDHYAE